MTHWEVTAECNYSSSPHDPVWRRTTICRCATEKVALRAALDLAIGKSKHVRDILVKEVRIP